MQRNILKEIEKRMINDFMDFLILSALKNDGGRLSGYDAIKYVYTRFHFLPSSGTVYSHLYAMERNGLLRGVQENRRRVYRLTSKGFEIVREVERANGNIQRVVARVFPSESVSTSRLP
jgi:DNA-binding PadR family transcriptional regulator